MKYIKALSFIIILWCFATCKQEPEPMRKYSADKNIIDVNNEIKPIDFTDIEISNFGTPYVLNDYLIATDYNSPDRLIHLFDNNTFHHISSIGLKGLGPDEITNMGRVIPDEKNNKFYFIDHGKQKVLSYSIDSILNNNDAKFTVESIINQTEFPSNFELINDSLLKFRKLIKKFA